MITDYDASNAIEFFESAVRGHENMGSQRPSDWPVVEEDLKNARAGMDEILHTLSILDRLRHYCTQEASEAQRKIACEGCSVELSHRADIMEEIIGQINLLDRTPREPAEPLFLP